MEKKLKSIAEVVLERHIERRMRRCEFEREMLNLIDKMQPSEFVEGLRFKHTEKLLKHSAALAQLQQELREKFGHV
ncbi:hypothetical protein M3194_12855 [Paenibacillus glycanilyticus]|uniref:hypothetical protein n=1 Tax=Paenibacillus glycanilyticus TaxID=126569 RepID=UPI0020415691|nr:hypothetical protein [Paenibacillus glycanilyticus]MCM3628255.1 hypothetical protein [Paenibacillus glycanilyticus]